MTPEGETGLVRDPIVEGSLLGLTISLLLSAPYNFTTSVLGTSFSQSTFTGSQLSHHPESVGA